MKITILQEHYETMIAHAISVLPEEACGLIAGVDRKDGVREIKKVILLENNDHSSEHFSIDPVQQLQVLRKIRNEGLQLLGNWHSHPKTPSRPSEEDKRLANDANASYLILSMANAAAPVLNAFHMEGTENARSVRNEELRIISQEEPE